MLVLNNIKHKSLAIMLIDYTSILCYNINANKNIERGMHHEGIWIDK